jgi:glycosyltransferase involved in cell wall biosynthesis
MLSSKFEGLSLSSIEGMASGKPFVATDVEGLTNILKGYGLLFKYQDDIELSTILLKLINDHEFYGEISALCLKRANEFSIEKLRDKLIDQYEKISQ